MKYHVRDALYFERHENGDVTVEYNGNRLTMTGDEWVSVIAAMSEKGETIQPLAKELHGKTTPREIR